MKMRGSVLLVGTAATALAMAGCGSGNTSEAGSNSGSGSNLVVGTTDKVVSLDPAGAYDNGSVQTQLQVYRYLVNFPEGATTPQPDAAEKCEFTEPTKYTCTMKDGLKFANGNPLTAKSAAFSFQRIVDIHDPNGPDPLLGNMESVAAPDDKTVVFTLKTPNDQTWSQVLVTAAGPIVDEKVFPPDKVLDDDAVVKADPFAGPYTIDKYQKNELTEFKKNPDYDGVYGPAKVDTVVMKYYTDANNMKLDISKGNIDIAWRSLTPTDIESLSDTDGVKVYKGAGGELRFIVFNLKTMPGKTPAQKLAIRQAVASSVDRAAISSQVYKGTYTPTYSVVPAGLPGATEPFKDIYGAGPDKAAATKFLTDAGVQTPVTLNLQYNPDHYGSSSAQEYNAIKRQLEDTGLFKVDLQSQEWTTYSKQRFQDAYPVFQLGWFPDFPDADNYLTPFFGSNNILGSHYENPELSKAIAKELTDEDQSSREAELGEAQKIVAEDVPIVPLLAGAQVAVARDDIQGVENTLDAAFGFRFTSVSKK